VNSEADGEAVARLAEEMARTARLLSEQAAEVAHYRKMYDRSSALARSASGNSISAPRS